MGTVWKKWPGFNEDRNMDHEYFGLNGESVVGHIFLSVFPPSLCVLKWMIQISCQFHPHKDNYTFGVCTLTVLFLICSSVPTFGLAHETASAGSCFLVGKCMNFHFLPSFQLLGSLRSLSIWLLWSFLSAELHVLWNELMELLNEPTYVIILLLFTFAVLWNDALDIY